VILKNINVGFSLS